MADGSAPTKPKILRLILVVLGLCVVATVYKPAASGDDDAKTSSFQSLARDQTEEDAIRRGEQLGIGEAAFAGPEELVVDSHDELKIRFTAGRAGMKTGGGLRVATQHGFGWDMWGGTELQTSDPRSENYLTFQTSTGSSLEWTTHQGGGRNPYFQRYHPWQNINEFILTGTSLSEGDSIEITFGDRSGGSPGVLIQQMDETAFMQKIYVDALGNGDYLPLRNSPTIEIVAAEPKELKVAAASTWEAGKPGWVNVWVDDGYGNPAASFRGAVTFSLAGARSDGAAAQLPPSYTFREADRGAHRFEGVRFSQPGTYRVVATDSENNLRAESNPFVVHRTAPRERIYWGDLHTHTLYSDGRGKPAETYDFGKRVAALDFCAVSDHAFVTTDEMWSEITEVTNQFNEPGRFVTLLGYEWSGQSDVGGDHNVYTSDPTMPLIRSYSYYNYENLRMYHGPDRGANHVGQLFRILAERFDDENIMAIPHYGGRQGNPAWHNPKIQRQIEIFSDHRRSEDWTSTFLNKGYRVGIMASTDNHSGNAGYGVRRREVVRGEEGELYSRVSPMERGTSLVAAYAEDLTRKSIFQALYHRRTYATTGERILLNFEVGGIPMGSEGRVNSPPKISASATGTADIKTMRVVKNGRIVHAISPQRPSASLEYVDNSGDYSGSFYYLDLVQVDGEKAVSSPVWTEQLGGIR